MFLEIYLGKHYQTFHYIFKDFNVLNDLKRDPDAISSSLSDHVMFFSMTKFQVICGILFKYGACFDFVTVVMLDLAAIVNSALAVVTNVIAV